MALDAHHGGRRGFVPAVCSRAWSAFWQIEPRRQWVTFTYQDGDNTMIRRDAMPIGFNELDAWSRMTGTRLMAWEIAALDRMERARLAFLNEIEQEPEISERELSPELFDALFC